MRKKIAHRIASHAIVLELTQLEAAEDHSINFRVCAFFCRVFALTQLERAEVQYFSFIIDRYEVVLSFVVNPFCSKPLIKKNP